MTLLLVRHGRAGSRGEWAGDDRLRPLDERGRRQAKSLVDQLAPFAVRCVLSSPAVRCVETVRPLAESRGLAVEEREELWEERWEDLPRLLREFADKGAVLCGHGGAEEHVGFSGRWQKGGTIVLADTLEPVRYLAPPA